MILLMRCRKFNLYKSEFLSEQIQISDLKMMKFLGVDIPTKGIELN